MQKLLCISAWLDQSKLRLDQSNFRSDVFFLHNSNSALAYYNFLGFYVLPRYIKQTLAAF